MYSAEYSAVRQVPGVKLGAIREGSVVVIPDEVSLGDGPRTEFGCPGGLYMKLVSGYRWGVITSDEADQEDGLEEKQRPADDRHHGEERVRAPARCHGRVRRRSEGEGPHNSH